MTIDQLGLSDALVRKGFVIVQSMRPLPRWVKHEDFQDVAVELDESKGVLHVEQKIYRAHSDIKRVTKGNRVVRPSWMHKCETVKRERKLAEYFDFLDLMEGLLDEA